MQDFLTYFFTCLTLLSAMIVVLSRNTIHSAMCMILSCIGIAGLFIVLEAYFLAALQVLIYAGAVMVLFLFIIMLLDVEALEKKPINKKRFIQGFFTFFVLACMFCFMLFLSFDLPSIPLQPSVSYPTEGSNPFVFCTSIKPFAYTLFTQYVLPFELAGILLLLAIVGVVVVSKKYTLEK